VVPCRNRRRLAVDETVVRLSSHGKPIAAAHRYPVMRVQSVCAGPGLALLKIDGELDFAGAPAVRTELVRAASTGAINWLVVDLAGVTAADDKGVASLSSAIRRLSSRQPGLRIIAVARDRGLADELSAASVPIYGYRSDDGRFIDPRYAA